MANYMRDALQGLDDFNTHNDTDISLEELLAPYISTHSSFSSFENLVSAAEESVQNDDPDASYVELTSDMLDKFIYIHFKTPVTCLHSLLTNAMNYYKE